MTSLAAMKAHLFFLIFTTCIFGNSFQLIAGGERTSRSSFFAEGGGPEVLLKQAKAIYKRDATKAVDLVTDAILIGIRTKNDNIQAEGYQLLGEINEYIEQYDLSISNYSKALDVYSGMQGSGRKIISSKSAFDKDKIHQLYRHLGRAHEKDGNLDEALRYYQLFVAAKTVENDGKLSLKDNSRSQTPKEVKVRKKTKVSSSNEVQEVQLAISNIYNKKRQFELSKDNIKKAELYDAVFTDSVDPLSNSIDFNLKAGDILWEQSDTQAIQYYNSSYQQAESLNRPDIAAEAIDKIADLYSKTDRIEESKKLRYKNIELLEEAKDTLGLANQYLEIGVLERKLGQDEFAEEAFEKALDLGEDVEDLDIQQKSLKEIADLAESNGNVDKALEYFKSFTTLQDSSIVIKEKELQRKLEISSTVGKQQQRVDLLEKNEEINAQTIEILRQNDRNQKILIYSLLGGILLLGGSGYLMYKNMRQRRIANQLIALRSLRSQMNPHFIFNALNSVNLYISQKDERTANKYLTDFSRLMRSVLEQSQNDFISLQQELDMISLYLSLEHDRFKDKFTYELNVDEDLDPEGLMLPPMLVQPYIENAIWHGLRYKEESGSLKVSYKLEDDAILVIIEDDGIGRKKSAELKTKNQLKTKSTGMYNIESRLKIINDMFKTKIDLQVSDLTNEYGTVVKVRIPLENQSVTV